ncbi:MAG TPA: hypothetical protein EYQ74_08560 [Planctomycetes bacterium]|nr:hypothetical protein [Planctomycetota bacterium]HIK60123.1 hypothetical protein [Planctomycetota bacterium]
MPDPSTATSTAPRRCSNCQAQLPDTPVSICPYCVMPVGDGTEGEQKESKNTPRLAKVRESDAFAEATGIAPPESPAFQQGARLTGLAWTLAAYGTAWLATDWLLKSVDLWSIPAGGFVVLLGIIQYVRGMRLRKQATSQELLCRPAVILSRRSEVELSGFSGSTTYFFELELKDGVIAEFSYAGRGPNADVYTNNLSGIAYTRGSTLLDFKQVRT